MPKMCVTDGVTLSSPFGDGRDYSGGDLIDLSPEKAEQWQGWGWVAPILDSRMPKTATDDAVMLDASLPEPAPEAIDTTPMDLPRRRKRKDGDAV